MKLDDFWKGLYKEVDEEESSTQQMSGFSALLYGVWHVLPKRLKLNFSL